LTTRTFRFSRADVFPVAHPIADIVRHFRRRTWSIKKNSLIPSSRRSPPFSPPDIFACARLEPGVGLPLRQRSRQPENDLMVHRALAVMVL
jgi:hypothetical protein